MSFFSPHIEIEQLADLVEGRLAADYQQTLAAHIALCRPCSEELSRVERIIAEMRDDSMEDAPAYALEKARRLLRTSIEPAPSVIKQVLATLKFDSLGSAPAFAVRSGAASDRQLMFSAGDTDIHLQIKQAEEQWVISGQVLGSCSGGEVELAGVEGMANTSLSELCEFTLDPVREGTYVLTLRTADAELKVPDLKLGS